MTYIKIYENVYLSIFDDDLILSWKIRFKQIKNKEEKKKQKKCGENPPHFLLEMKGKRVKR